MPSRTRAVAGEAIGALRERPRDLLILLAIAVLVMASYGFARPAVESLFVDRYGSRNLPWAYLAVAVSVVFVTAGYNRLAARMSLAQLWPVALALATATLVVFWVAERAGIRPAAYALFVWKDVYIVVVVELFWSIANVTFPIRQARWIYGLFLAAGSAGSIIAELWVGELAGAVGTSTSVLAAIPLLLAAALLAPRLPVPARLRPTPGAIPGVLSRGLEVLRGSRYLLVLLGLIGTVQIAITVIDYQYNVALEAHFPDIDARTDVGGKVYAAINTIALGLQLASGPLLRFVGVPLIILAMPLLLLLGLAGFAVASRFATMVAVKVASKALDYSLGRAAKEILYIPLTYREKTEGKAIVDLLTYRVAKGAASLLLIWLTATELGGGAVLVLLFALLGLWLVFAAILAARFKHDQDRLEEMSGRDAL